MAASRDEFHDRPARPMVAGRDERAGGTWLAIRRDGRWAVVTNFRGPHSGQGARSRGELPAGFVAGVACPKTYVEALYERHGDYGPFDLLVGDREQVW